MSGPDEAPGRPEARPRPRSLRDLATLTEARVALGAFGSGVPTAAALRFNLDHARAREAVWAPLDADALRTALAASGLSTLEVRSNAADRAEYIRRPDKGRTLSDGSAAILREHAAGTGGCDLAVVVADGLSATAVAVNAAPFVATLAALARRAGWRMAPVVVAHEGRVALGDPVGTILGARCVVVLLGERPGLSAADSLGCYVTLAPEPGLPDSRRNCLSNIRGNGLHPADAAAQCAALLHAMMAQGTSGVLLRRPGALPALEG